MPARRKIVEPQTPPNTPPRTRDKRNNSGSSLNSSLGSLGSLSSSGSQRYSALLRERPSASSSVSSLEYTRLEELYGQIRLSSQPSINNSLDSDLEDDFTNQPISLSTTIPTVTDRSISDIRNIPNIFDSTNKTNTTNNINNINNINSINNTNNDVNNNDNPGFLKRGFDFLTGLLAKILNLIGFTIFLIYWSIKTCLDFIWINLNRPFSENSVNTSTAVTTTSTTTTTTTTNNNNNNNNKRSRRLFFAFVLFVIIVLLLLSTSRGEDNIRLIDYFPLHDKIHIWPLGGRTYKIQPIEKNNNVNEILRGDDGKNDGIVITLDDFKQLIITEVRKYMKAGDDELLRSVVMEEIKSTLSKKGIINLRPERDQRLHKAIKGEEMLEIIRKEARNVAKDELLKYSQDKLNRPDFALHSGGAKIISKFTSKTYEVWPDKWYRKAFASLSGRGIIRGKPPVTAIQDETNVGQCWPFAGQEGQLAVMLSRRAYVTAVTYDHVSKDISVDIYSAPKQFEVWGLIDEGINGRIKDEEEDLDFEAYDMESTEETCGPRVDGKFEDRRNNNLPGNSNSNGGRDGLNYLSSGENLTKGELDLGSSVLHVFLGRFTYDIGGLPVQTFEIPPNLRVNKPIRTIIMKVNSNWGKSEYTCLYRFRVHGDPADKADN